MSVKIAILSGKGGTGKTFISTNLAYILARNSRVQLLDCDVEEPNDHLFIYGITEFEKDVVKQIPVVNQQQCTHCGICANECQFGAIASYPNGTIVFKQLCHGCGLCMTLCPEGAISEVPEPIGKISQMQVSDQFHLSMGLLNIGEPSAVPVIRELKKHLLQDKDYYIFDSPPGASCPVVETLRGMDFAILVTESSPFGLHDLKNVLEIVEEMKIRFGVIINRYDESFVEMEQFLKTKNIPILLKIPFDRNIATAYSNGQLYAAINENFVRIIEQLVEKIKETVHETDRSS